MHRPASELFAPLDEYYPRRIDYRTTKNFEAALGVWERGEEPRRYLLGMTPSAQRRFPESRREAGAHPAGQRGLSSPATAGGGALPVRESIPSRPGGYRRSDLMIWAVAILVALGLAASAFAQDEGRDEALRQEQDRLAGHQVSGHPKRRGYRGRVTASDYELEFQMQQLDKQRQADDLARLDEIRIERDAIRDAQKPHWRGLSEEYSRQTQEAKAPAQRMIEEMKARNEQQAQALQRQQEISRAATQARIEAMQQQGAQQAQDFFERSRTPPPPVPQLQPIQPAPAGPSVPGAYFPDLPNLPRDNRTPLEAYNEGAALGRAIGDLFTAPARKRASERKDAIVKKHINGTATREDYAQLIDDGYSSLALELFRESDHFPK